MVLLAGMEGTARLELWNRQLSLSGRVLSPHMVSIKLGYLGNKNVDFEMGQTKQEYFSTALGKDGPQRKLSYLLLLSPGVWEKLQGAIRRRLQGWEQRQEQAAQGLLGVQTPSCSWTRLSPQHIKYLSCSL